MTAQVRYGRSTIEAAHELDKEPTDYTPGSFIFLCVCVLLAIVGASWLANVGAALLGAGVR